MRSEKRSWEKVIRVVVELEEYFLGDGRRRGKGEGEEGEGEEGSMAGDQHGLASGFWGEGCEEVVTLAEKEALYCDTDTQCGERWLYCCTAVQVHALCWRPC